MTWQPIESAPTGKRILVSGNGGLQFGYLDDLGNWRSDGEGKRIRSVAPKYWMPLPNPPDATIQPAKAAVKRPLIKAAGC